MIDIKPLIDYGHIHFGENKVQEAVEKWSKIKNNFIDLQLHMVGKLQTNKVKFILPLFDYIHSLDNLKLAEKISIEQEKKLSSKNIYSGKYCKSLKKVELKLKMWRLFKNLRK